jgi:hypothetical protein
LQLIERGSQQMRDCAGRHRRVKSVVEIGEHRRDRECQSPLTGEHGELCAVEDMPAKHERRIDDPVNDG